MSAKDLSLEGPNAFDAARFKDAERLFVASLDAVPRRSSTLVSFAATWLKLQRPVDAIAAADALLPRSPTVAWRGAEALSRALGRATAKAPADPAVRQVVAKAGSPIEYLDVPGFQPNWTPTVGRPAALDQAGLRERLAS